MDEVPGTDAAGNSMANPGRRNAEWLVRILLRGAAVLLLLFIVASVLLPGTGGRSRVGSNRTQCASRLRQIGLACKMYANEHGPDFLYPPSLGVAFLTQDIAASCFVCPFIATEPPDAKLSRAEQARQIDDPSMAHCSYYYAGAGLNDSTDADDVMAFEMPNDDDPSGINVLYCDGHVDWSAASHEAGPNNVNVERLMADYKSGKRPLRLPVGP